MKRISVLTIAVLMLLPGITGAYHRVSSRFRTRYSPYAFSYEYPSGLISGELEYSPYAFSHKNPSGLVPYWLRYSPYAFSHKHPSGLISDYSSYYYFPYDRVYYLPYGFNYGYSGLFNCNPHNRPHASGYEQSKLSAEMRNNYEERLRAQRDRTRRLRDYRNKMSIIRENDGKEIIYNYLKSKNIDDFEVDRLLKIDNKTISVNFVFRDKNIIVKYWNPEEIQSLIQQPGYKKNYYEKYAQQWKDFCQTYKERGGEVYQIKSANREEILSKLSICHELSEG